MAWWAKLFQDKAPPSLEGEDYRIAATLYSMDGKRQVEILELRSGAAYLIESEWVEETTFRNRHGASPVGPFRSAKKAERFIVGTPWFTGGNAR